MKYLNPELDLASMVLNHHHLFSLEHYLTRFFQYLKGTESVISSDPPCKDGNVRFTTVPLKPCSDKKC